MNINLYSFIPFIIYLIFLFIFPYIYNRINRININKTSDQGYFLGNSSLKSFILAMTISSTYVASSSFIGGPALAYKYGLSWVLLACIQLPLIILIFGVSAKRIRYLAKKINAFSIIDIIEHHFKSQFIANLVTILVIFFYIILIVSQFVGGAKLLEVFMNIPYKLGLTTFTIIIFIYTIRGGFNSVILTDTLQGLIMLLSTILMLVFIVIKVGSFEAIEHNIIHNKPYAFSPTAEGQLNIRYISSFWVLVGLGMLAQPSFSFRFIAAKDNKSIVHGMIIATIVTGILTIGMHLNGFFSIAIIDNMEDNDKIIPYIATNIFPPLVSGIFVSGLIAAIMSTADTLLLMCSLLLTHNLFPFYQKISNRSNKFYNKNIASPTKENTNKTKNRLIINILLSIIVYLLSLFPLGQIIQLNLYALGGIEASLFTITIVTLFTKYKCKISALNSIISGLAIYVYMKNENILLFHILPIVWAILFSIVSFALTTFVTNKSFKT